MAPLAKIPASRRGRRTSQQRELSGCAPAVKAKKVPKPNADVDPVRQLENFLQHHGAFPDAQRPHAWRILLHLPRNEDAFNAMGVAPLSSLPLWIQEKQEAIFQLTGGSEADAEKKVLMKTLQRLASWNPPLAEMDYLPSLISPFRYVFGDDEVLLFEVCVLFFLAWGESYVTGPWMEGVLDKPRYLLEHAWMLLSVVDKELHVFLQSPKIGDARYTIIWPMLQTLFFDCLPKPAWMVLWDHLVVFWKEPYLLAVAAVAILRCLRNVLLICQDDAIQTTLKHTQVIPIPSLLKEFYSLRIRSSSLALKLTNKSVDRLILPGAYPVFPFELNAALDYLVRDRSRSRSEIETFRFACCESEKKYRAIQQLVCEETKAQEERALQLRNEEACRSLNLKEDGKLELEQERHLNALLAIRLERLNSASTCVMVAQEQQQNLQQAECLQQADELARQRRRLANENETWKREIEFSSTEAWAIQQMSGIARHHRIEAASRELRQKAQAEIRKRDREDEVIRLSQRKQDENDRACMRMDLERQLESFQWNLADFHKKEIQGQLRLDDYIRKLQLGEVDRERTIRSAAHEARMSGALKLQSLQRALTKEERCIVEAHAKAIGLEHRRQEDQLQKQWHDADEVRLRTRQSFDRQEAKLHRLGLIDEQDRFDLRLQQSVEANEIVKHETEAALCQELANIESVRRQAERAEALDARRRELLARRHVVQQCSRRVATEILSQDRQRFASSLDVGLDRSASETTDTNSERE